MVGGADTMQGALYLDVPCSCARRRMALSIGKNGGTDAASVEPRRGKNEISGHGTHTANDICVCSARSNQKSTLVGTL